MTSRGLTSLSRLSAPFVSGLAIAIVAVISVLDLVGWMLDLPLLKGINPQWAPMPVITALCFLMSAAALVCARDRTSMRRLVAARILGVVVSAAGLLTVASYLAELQLGQAWLLGHSSWMSVFEPHRTAVIGAILFTLFGGVLVLLGSDRRHAADIGHVLLLPAAILTYLILIGYLLNVRVFYEWAHRGVALNTGLAFGALCVAAFYIRPDTWLMAVFSGAETGAIMARRLLPGLLLLPLLIAWLRLAGERSGLFVSEVGVALVAVTYAVCFLALVWSSARSVNRAERLRRQAEAIVRENEERLKHALAAGEFGAWSLDTKTGRAWRSLRHDQIFGYARLLPEWTYAIFLRHVLEADRPEVEAKFGHALAAGQNWDFECRIRRVDGAVRWIWAQGKPKLSAQNEVTQLIGLIRDITERKQMENELRQSRDALESRVREKTAELAHTVETLRNEIDQRQRAERQVRAASIYTRSLIEASLDPLVTISPEGRITDVNRATEEATGVSRGRLIGADFSGYFVEPEKAREGYRKVLAEGAVRDYALTLRHVSGRLTNVLYNASVYRNEAGAVEGVFAAARDVTERKQMEDKLRMTSLYTRSLIEASLDPLVTIGPDGKITDVNAATETVTGYCRQDLIGADFSGYFTAPEKAQAGYQQVFREGLVRDYPLEIRHRNGWITPVLYNASVYRDQTGAVIGVFAAARDITERKKAEAERLQYQDRLRSLAIKLATTEEDERRRLSRQIHDTVVQSLSLSTIKLGSTTLALEKAALAEELVRLKTVRELIDEAIAQCRLLMSDLTPPMLYELGLVPALDDLIEKLRRQHGAVIDLEDDGHPKPMPNALRGLLFQSLRELVINALKHAGPCRITLSLKLAGDHIAVKVADNGVGFDIVQPPEPAQADARGFGLFNIRERVEGLGGRFEIRSHPGRGTTATLIVPLQPPAAGSAAVPD